MRRKEREKDEAFAYDVLRDCEYATLATVNPDGTPYCITLSPVLMDGAIYFHCAPTGHKLDNIAQNPAVCLSAACDTRLLPQEFSTQYRSAVVFGRCDVVTEEAEQIAALRAICEKYAADNLAQVDAVIARSLHRTCVCKITIKYLTGKGK